MTTLIDDSTQMSFAYKSLKPGQYDEKEKEIRAYIEQQSKIYKKKLIDIVYKPKIAYRPERIERTVAHFKELFDEAVRWNTSLGVSVFPNKREVIYTIKEEAALCSIQDHCVWKDFILYGQLKIVCPSFKIKTSLPPLLSANFDVKNSVVFSLADNSIFKDFLMSSCLEITAAKGKKLLIIGKEACF